MFQNYRRFTQTKAYTTARYKTRLYNDLILSHINYSITIWGYKGSRIFKTGSSNNNIEQVQFTYRTTFKKLQILKTSYQVKLQELKNIHGNLPVYLLIWNVIPIYYIHGYNTRKAEHIHTSLTRYEFVTKSLTFA